jgi:hypothetical protein
MDPNALIRIRVLSALLVEALEELDADAFSSPQLVEQLREIGSRAAEELDQRASAPSE